MIMSLNSKNCIIVCSLILSSLSFTNGRVLDKIRKIRSVVHRVMEDSKDFSNNKTIKAGEIDWSKYILTKPPEYDRIWAAEQKAAKVSDGTEEIGPSDDIDEENEFSIRAGTSYQRWRWNKFQMWIVIDESFPQEQFNTIRAAIWHLGDMMDCFHFLIIPYRLPIPKKKSRLFIKYNKTGTCRSLLGRRGLQQTTLLTENCFGHLWGTTLHEIMHVLGFYHEHVRPDRDLYIVVDWHALKNKQESFQYEKQAHQHIYVSDYDFESIMHYSMHKMHARRADMIPPGVTPGQRSHLSEMDILRLQRAYSCSDAPPFFIDPNDPN